MKYQSSPEIKNNMKKDTKKIQNFTKNQVLEVLRRKKL